MKVSFSSSSVFLSLTVFVKLGNTNSLEEVSFLLLAEFLFGPADADLASEKSAKF